MSSSTPPPQHPAGASVTSRVLGVLTPEGAVVLGFLGVAFLGLFFRWFHVQHRISSTQLEDWGHAYIIPVISGYMIWKNKAQIAAIKPTVFWPGLAPFVLGIMSYFLGVVGIKNHMFQGFSIVLAMLGLSLLLLGPAMIRYLFMPILFLVFGVTVSQRIMIDLTFPLQLAASQGGYFVLSVIGAVGGFNVEVEGNVIKVISSSGVEHPLSIAEACSGMRMVVAFFALAVATSLLGTRIWWQRVAIVLLAAPVALIINTARVSVLGVLSLFDADLAGGEAHAAIGMFLLIPGMFLFLAVIWALNKIIKPDATGGGA